MRVIDFNFNIDRQYLKRPFKFKGGQFTEKWINITSLSSEEGYNAVGIGSTAILWSDPNVFSANSEIGGNLLMSAISQEAVKLILNKDYKNPIEAMHDIIEPLYKYAQKITNTQNLRKTFVLNSLISLDNALWKLYALENNIDSFDELIPTKYRPGLSEKQSKLACLPLITYNVCVNEVVNIVKEGTFFLKVKIGQSGTQDEMLEKDKSRLIEIHKSVKNKRSQFTQSSKIVYYLDANGRYKNKSTIVELLEYADKIGMLENIIILEEPFPEESEIDVSSLPVIVSADESLHSVEDANARINMGYKALTLKPAGKTLSLSMEMALLAYQRSIPCYVADSACIPALVEWNKNIAVRLPTFPKLKIGFIESNGSAFYSRWDEMLQEHPCFGSEWISPINGIFNITDSFYEKSGGIFEIPNRYKNLLKQIN